MKTYFTPTEVIATTLARIATRSTQYISDSEMVGYRHDAQYHIDALVDLGDIPKDAIIVSAEELKQEINDAVQRARKDWYARDTDALTLAKTALNEANLQINRARVHLLVPHD
jgi:hypothetical protein